MHRLQESATISSAYLEKLKPCAWTSAEGACRIGAKDMGDPGPEPEHD
jgi:hypothetical protein